MTSGDIQKEEFVDELFRFITKHFNDFKHKKNSGTKTWFTPSWAPYIEACFIQFGDNKQKDVGSSYTHGKLEMFWNKYIKTVYRKPIDRFYDVSWHETNFEFLLGLEHEEEGLTDLVRLENILDELIKLRSYKGKNKILISRPYFNTTQLYSTVENNYKIKIEEKIRNLNTNDDETWIVIMIGLKDPVNSLTNEIIFSCYFWDKNIKELSEFNKGLKIPIKLENRELKLIT